MNRFAVADIKEKANELAEQKLNQICSELNSEYEDLLFYVKDKAIWIDCSDYSPRDVKILQI